MMKEFLLALVLSPLIYSTKVPAQTMDRDPYSAIEHIVFENGLQLFLAPSKEALTAEVEVKVNVGWEAEDSSNWGISHLLEHVLFRDQKLKDEMTYLQLIREAGGSANGETNRRETRYFGSIPSEKSTWLFDTISKMILHPSISDQYVQKEKGTVELEIGRPGPVSIFLGLNPQELIYPKYLNPPTFWETEFQVDYAQPFTTTEEQLSSRRLTTGQIEKYYEDYYHPANMSVFIAGNFDRKRILDAAHQTWAKLPKKDGKRLAPETSPVPKRTPYVSYKVEEDTPYVYIGTKVWDVNIGEREAISAYMEYLSHSLMKEIRNLKGQTYSAQATTQIYNGFGYSTIQFQTPRENLRENLEYTKRRLEIAEQGKLSDAEVTEAKSLYLGQYRLNGKEGRDMMKLAEDYYYILIENKNFESPYSALSRMTPGEFNEALRKHFKKNQRYEFVYRPALLFQYDYLLAMALLAIGLFIALRRILTKSFRNDRIQWVRKVKYPPLMSLEFLLTVLGWYLLLHVAFGINLLFASLPILQSFFMSQYLRSFVGVFIIIAIAQGLMSVVPRKLMVMDGQFMIKSLSYYSRKISISEIQAVKSLRIWRLLGHLNWRALHKFRFYFFSPLIWRDGLLIRLNDGRVYFLSVASGKHAQKELMGLVEAARLARCTKSPDRIHRA